MPRHRSRKTPFPADLVVHSGGRKSSPGFFVNAFFYGLFGRSAVIGWESLPLRQLTATCEKPNKPGVSRATAFGRWRTAVETRSSAKLPSLWQRGKPESLEDPCRNSHFLVRRFGAGMNRGVRATARFESGKLQNRVSFQLCRAIAGQISTKTRVGFDPSCPNSNLTVCPSLHFLVGSRTYCRCRISRSPPRLRLLSVTESVALPPNSGKRYVKISILTQSATHTHRAPALFALHVSNDAFTHQPGSYRL